MTDNKTTKMKNHLSGLTLMIIGAIIVFGSVVLMNRYVERKETAETNTVKMDVQKAKKKKKPPVKKKVRKQKQKPKRSAPPPPAGLDSVIGGSGIGLGFDLNDMGIGNEVGNMDDMVMTADTVDEIPQAASIGTPLSYPKRARAKGVEGFVKFNILVSSTGEIERVKILESTPAGVFDQAALSFVKSWKFSPAMYQGSPVRVWVNQTVRFALDGN